MMTRYRVVWLNLLWLFLGSVQSQTEDMCLWYVTGTYTFLNGEFVYQGEYQDDPYWKQTSDDCSYPELYLYLSYSDQWLITKTLGGTTYVAVCDLTGLAHPMECGKNWKLGSSNVVDSNAYFMGGECPYLQCDSIKLDYVDSSQRDLCIGTWDVHVNNSWRGENVYKRSDGSSRYIYFNEKSFEWLCYEEVNKSSCYTYWGRTKNESANFVQLYTHQNAYFHWYSQYSSYQTLNFTCLGGASSGVPTPSPTPRPTPAPTFEPTIESVSPTQRTDDPTEQPTPHPTHVAGYTSTSAAPTDETSSPTTSVTTESPFEAGTTQAGDGLNRHSKGMPIWMWLVIGVIIGFIIGCAIIAYIARRKKKKPKDDYQRM